MVIFGRPLQYGYTTIQYRSSQFCLADIKPLPERMVTCRQLAHLETNFGKIWIKIPNFRPCIEHFIWKRRLQEDVGHCFHSFNVFVNSCNCVTTSRMRSMVCADISDQFIGVAPISQAVYGLVLQILWIYVLLFDEKCVWDRATILHIYNASWAVVTRRCAGGIQLFVTS